jgi:hypothetical protein
LSSRQKRRTKEAPAARGQTPGIDLASWIDYRAPYLIPLLLALVARVLYWILLPTAAEDAYITFRYAENWAAGLGPVYNSGERVMGFSSPLWTAWIAIGSLITGKTLIWARISSILLDAGTILLGARILQREHSRFSAWAFGVFYALWPTLVAYSLLGMETSLFVFLIVASAWACVKRHPSAGPLLALLAFTRPEATVAAMIIALGAGWRDRLIALAMFGFGVVVLSLYYGNPIPQSVLAKAATYAPTGPAGARVWVDGFVPALLGGRWPTMGEMQHLIPLAVVGTPAAILAIIELWKKSGAARLVGASGLVVLSGYCLVGVTYFAWYTVVPIMAWAWLAAIGLPRISRHPALLVGLSLYISTELIAMRSLYGGRVQAEDNFRIMGLLLKEASGGQGTVFLEPIGHIGYISRMHVIDEVGLVSPDVQKRREQGDGWYADTVREEQPGFLVVRAEFLEQNQAWAGKGAPFRSPEERDQLLAAYEHAFGGPNYEKLPMRILKLKD